MIKISFLVSVVNTLCMNMLKFIRVIHRNTQCHALEGLIMQVQYCTCTLYYNMYGHIKIVLRTHNIHVIYNQHVLHVIHHKILAICMLHSNPTSYPPFVWVALFVDPESFFSLVSPVEPFCSSGEAFPSSLDSTTVGFDIFSPSPTLTPALIPAEVMSMHPILV